MTKRMHLKQRYWLVSIALSFICITGIVYQNVRLARIYHESSGKTRALFGLIEIGQWYVKVGLGVVTIIAVVLALISCKYSEKKMYWIAAIIFNVFSFILLFFPLWSIMI